MKCVLALSAALSLSFCSATVVAQHVSTIGPVRITGFSNGVYSVESETAAQLMKNVVTPIKLALAHRPNDKVTVNVQGCATTNGTTVTNATAGQTRASNVEGFLQQQLGQYPNVRFVPWSNGSAANAWEVVVTATIVAPISPPISKEIPAATSSKYRTVAVALGLLLVALLVGVIQHGFARGATRTAVATPTLPTAIDASAPKPSLIKIAFEATRPDGRTCRAFITVREGLFFTPFFSMEEPRQPLFRRDRRKAIQAGKQCIGNPAYQSEIDALIAANEIHEIETLEAEEVAS